MKFVTTLILVAAAGMCSAADYTKQYKDCMDDSEGGVESALSCAAPETRKQAAVLDAAYKAALEAIPKPRQPKLREAQRNWLKFQQSNCESYYDPETPSTRREAASCILFMTAERSAELKRFIDSQ